MRQMSFSVLLFVVLATQPLSALADTFQPIREKQAFLSLVNDRDLRIGLYNLTLRVLPDGKIVGKALGWAISGNWTWEGGYFCRDMDWSGYAIPFNCQLVEAKGERELRFTVDRGAGNSASFRLR
ncbi:MAG: dihydrodipicolinate reductase [Paracoccaceae bacterium]